MVENPGNWRAERFWARVNKGPSCWMWTGSTRRNPYGDVTLTVGGKRFKGAHRIAYALTNGHDFQGHVLHRCDNRACCNPAHLYEGNDRDNGRDRKLRENMNEFIKRGWLIKDMRKAGFRTGQIAEILKISRYTVWRSLRNPLAPYRRH